jgi:hypothetical protein
LAIFVTPLASSDESDG